MNIQTTDQAMLRLASVSDDVFTATAVASVVLQNSSNQDVKDVGKSLFELSRIFLGFAKTPRSSYIMDNFPLALNGLEFLMEELVEYAGNVGVMEELQEAYHNGKEAWDWAEMVMTA